MKSVYKFILSFVMLVLVISCTPKTSSSLVTSNTTSQTTTSSPKVSSVMTSIHSSTSEPTSSATSVTQAPSSTSSLTPSKLTFTQGDFTIVCNKGVLPADMTFTMDLLDEAGPEGMATIGALGEREYDENFILILDFVTDFTPHGQVEIRIVRPLTDRTDYLVYYVMPDNTLRPATVSIDLESHPMGEIVFKLSAFYRIVLTTKKSI